MKKFIRSTLSIVLGLSLTTGVAFADSSSSAIGNGQWPGSGMDIAGYCAYMGMGPDASVITGTQDWACSNNGTGPAVKLHKVCQWENPGLNSVKEEVSGNPYTWNCFK
ncbi:MAG TPA: hypothetical protein VEW42_03940 [Candidatus Eisenbacteria bacterium]|nr:hypothetical protein [Candidatus Eisenbacteria bacterium]